MQLITEHTNNLIETDQASKFPIVIKIVESVKKILEEDKKQKHPLFINVKESVIFNIARRALNEPGSRFLIGIAGESASGKTTFV